MNARFVGGTWDGENHKDVWRARYVIVPVLGHLPRGLREPSPSRPPDQRYRRVTLLRYKGEPVILYILENG